MPIEMARRGKANECILYHCVFIALALIQAITRRHIQLILLRMPREYGSLIRRGERTSKIIPFREIRAERTVERWVGNILSASGFGGVVFPELVATGQRLEHLPVQTDGLVGVKARCHTRRNLLFGPEFEMWAILDAEFLRVAFV